MSIYTGNSEETSIALITCGNCYNSEESIFEYYLNEYALYIQYECPECGSQFNHKLVLDDSEHFTFKTDWNKDILEPILSKVHKEVNVSG